MYETHRVFEACKMKGCAQNFGVLQEKGDFCPDFEDIIMKEIQYGASKKWVLVSLDPKRKRGILGKQ
jgi:hypothetical protein